MAVPEQIPVVNYVADGIVKKFDVPFEYDQQSDLHIYVDGVEPTIDKYFFADNSFNFYIAPTVGQNVKIKRITPKERDTDYNLHTNTVRPKALNTDFDRLWYVLQEVFSDVGGLSQAVQDEIIARIQGDEDLLNQLTAEISARMLGDEAVTEDLKNYVNQVVGAIINDPDFNGIDADKVNDASGETQQQINYNQQTINNYLQYVNSWGAIGDGTLHTLQEWVDSGKFSSLTAIQFVYPKATSLTDSIDAVAIQACLDYCQPLGKRACGVAGSNYMIDKTIDLNCNADFEGTTFTVDKLFSSSVVKTASTTLGVNLLSKLVIKYPTILNNRTIGVDVPVVGSKGIYLEGVRNCSLYFGGIRGFETNLYMFSNDVNKYISYNQFFFGDLIAGSKVNIHWDIQGTGWINQCVWNGGQFAQFTGDTALFNTVCLKHSKVFGGQNAGNGHTFVGCSMEGAFTQTILYDFDPAITTSYYSSNTWVGCRFEAAVAMTFNQYALYDTFILCRGLDTVAFTNGQSLQFVGCPRITNFIQDISVLVGAVGMRTSKRSHIFQSNNSANALALAVAFNGNINGGFKSDGSLVVFNSADTTKVFPHVQVGMISGTPSFSLGDGNATPTERIFRNNTADWRMNVSLSPSATGVYNLGSASLRFNEMYAVKFRASEGLGVWGTVPPTTKPSITGKITPTTIAEQNAVLSSIVSALVSYGLVSDDRT